MSGKGQVEGDGFERQRQAIARFAKAAKFDLVDEFRDEGVSGTKAALADSRLVDARSAIARG